MELHSEKGILAGPGILSGLFGAQKNVPPPDAFEHRQASPEVAGRAGEEEVKFHFKYLPPGYRQLHRLRLKAKGMPPAEIDHVVIGPNGIFVIETKNWAGRIIASPQGWRQVRDGREEGVESPGAQLWRHIAVVKKAVEESVRVSCKLTMHGIIVVANRRAVVEGQDDTYPVLKAEEIARHITTQPGANTLGTDVVADMLLRHRVERRS